MKNAKTFSAVAVLFVMSACGRGASPPSVGSFAKPTETAAKLQACADSKSSSLQPFVSEKIMVCRRDDAGVVATTLITPGFYVAAKQKRIRIAQVVGVDLSFNGTTPTKDHKDQAENAVVKFLTEKCEPKFRTIFKRSGLLGRFVFQTFVDTDHLAGSSISNGGSVGDRDELFGESQNRTAGSNETKKQIGIDRSRLSPNVRLKLILIDDASIMIKDAVTPISSGALEAKDNDDQQNKFCAQLLVRMGENMGLGALKADDTTCVDPASLEMPGKDAKATDVKTDAKAEAKTDSTATPVAAKPTDAAAIGIMKAGSVAAKDFVNLKLAKEEVKTLLTPICGSLETLPKVDKTSNK